MLSLNVSYELDEGAYKPYKAHPEDAGFDLCAKDDVDLSPDKTFKVDTGVHVFIPSGFVGLVLPRSSFSCQGVGTATGVIDAGYTGSISIVLTAKFSRRIFAGNRIAQLVIVPLPKVKLCEGRVSEMESERGSDGFGSTGEEVSY